MTSTTSIASSNENCRIAELTKNMVFMALTTLETSSSADEFEEALLFMSSTIPQLISSFIYTSTTTNDNDDNITPETTATVIEFLTRLGLCSKIAKNVSVSESVSSAFFDFFDRICFEFFMPDTAASIPILAVMNSVLVDGCLLPEKIQKLLSAKTFDDLLIFDDSRQCFREFSSSVILEKLEQLPYDEESFFVLMEGIVWPDLFHGPSKHLRDRFLDVMILRFLPKIFTGRCLRCFLDVVDHSDLLLESSRSEMISYFLVLFDKIPFSIDEIIDRGDDDDDDDDPDRKEFVSALRILLSILINLVEKERRCNHSSSTSSFSSSITSESVWIKVATSFSLKSIRDKLFPIREEGFSRKQIVGFLKTTMPANMRKNCWDTLVSIILDEKGVSMQDFSSAVAIFGALPSSQQVESDSTASSSLSHLTQFFDVILASKGKDFFSKFVYDNKLFCAQILCRTGGGVSEDLLENEGKIRELLRRNQQQQNNDHEDLYFNCIVEVFKTTMKRQMHPCEVMAGEDGELFEYNMTERPHGSTIRRNRVAAITTTSVHCGREKQDYTPEMYHWDCLRRDDPKMRDDKDGGDDTSMAEICGEELVIGFVVNEAEKEEEEEETK